jgi:hypothetical protein
VLVPPWFAWSFSVAGGRTRRLECSLSARSGLPRPSDFSFAGARHASAWRSHAAALDAEPAAASRAGSRTRP